MKKFLCLIICALVWALWMGSPAQAASSYTDGFGLEMPALGDTSWDDAIRTNHKIFEVVTGAVQDGNQVVSGVSPSSSGSALTFTWSAGVVWLSGASYYVRAGTTDFTTNKDIVWVTVKPITVDAPESGGTVEVRETEDYMPSAVSGYPFAPIALCKTDATGIWQMRDVRNFGPTKASASIPPKMNLLTNSGFGVWSNSDGAHKMSGVSVSAMSGGSVTLVDAPTTFTVTVGQLFTFGGAGSNQEDTGVSTYFVTSVTDQKNFQLNSTGIDSGATDTYPASAGCIGADYLAMDGWSKNSEIDIYREQASVKSGSLYAVKIVSNSTPARGLWWPGPSTTIRTLPHHYSRFAGKTVTFGCWIKADTADSVQLRIFDNITGTYSPYHTGGGEWEWLEATYTVPDTAQYFSVFIYDSSANELTFYARQPMLVYGNYIGTGNYNRPVGETVWFENDVTSYRLNSLVSQSTTAAAQTVYAPADSGGAIPNDAQAIAVMVQGNDSGSAGGNCYFWLRKDTAQAVQFWLSPYGLANDAQIRLSGWQALTPSATYDYSIGATGANTFDVYTFKYLGVQLR